MPLRVRCPECKTTLDVPTGVRPKCPKCGFAGRSGTGGTKAPVKKEGVKFTRAAPAAVAPAPAASAAPQAASAVEWQAEEAPAEWPTEGEAAPAEWPAEGEAPAEWPAEGEADEWEQAPTDAWSPEEPAQPAKKGWFGRKKA